MLISFDSNCLQFQNKTKTSIIFIYIIYKFIKISLLSNNHHPLISSSSLLKPSPNFKLTPFFLIKIQTFKKNLSLLDRLIQMPSTRACDIKLVNSMV